MLAHPMRMARALSDASDDELYRGVWDVVARNLKRQPKTSTILPRPQQLPVALFARPVEATATEQYTPQNSRKLYIFQSQLPDDEDMPSADEGAVVHYVNAYNIRRRSIKWSKGKTTTIHPFRIHDTTRAFFDGKVQYELSDGKVLAYGVQIKASRMSKHTAWEAYDVLLREVMGVPSSSETWPYTGAIAYNEFGSKFTQGALKKFFRQPEGVDAEANRLFFRELLSNANWDYVADTLNLPDGEARQEEINAFLTAANGTPHRIWWRKVRTPSSPSGLVPNYGLKWRKTDETTSTDVVFDTLTDFKKALKIKSQTNDGVIEFTLGELKEWNVSVSDLASLRPDSRIRVDQNMYFEPVELIQGEWKWDEVVEDVDLPGDEIASITSKGEYDRIMTQLSIFDLNKVIKYNDKKYRCICYLNPTETKARDGDHVDLGDGKVFEVVATFQYGDKEHRKDPKWHRSFDENRRNQWQQLNSALYNYSGDLAGGAPSAFQSGPAQEERMRALLQALEPRFVDGTSAVTTRDVFERHFPKSWKFNDHLLLNRLDTIMNALWSPRGPLADLMCAVYICNKTSWCTDATEFVVAYDFESDDLFALLYLILFLATKQKSTTVTVRPIRDFIHIPIHLVLKLFRIIADAPKAVTDRVTIDLGLPYDACVNWKHVVEQLGGGANAAYPEADRWHGLMEEIKPHTNDRLRVEDILKSLGETRSQWKHTWYPIDKERRRSFQWVDYTGAEEYTQFFPNQAVADWENRIGDQIISMHEYYEDGARRKKQPAPEMAATSTADDSSVEKLIADVPVATEAQELLRYLVRDLPQKVAWEHCRKDANTMSYDHKHEFQKAGEKAQELCDILRTWQNVHPSDDVEGDLKEFADKHCKPSFAEFSNAWHDGSSFTRLENDGYARGMFSKGVEGPDILMAAHNFVKEGSPSLGSQSQIDEP